MNLIIINNHLILYLKIQFILINQVIFLMIHLNKESKNIIDYLLSKYFDTQFLVSNNKMEWIILILLLIQIFIQYSTDHLTNLLLSLKKKL